MDTLSGQQMGQYVLQEQIGEGGMAVVYRALQPSIDREVAVKFLPRQLAERNPSFLDRFYREVKIAAQLQHPHIVPIYDFGEHDGVPFIVMAYFDGGSLADWIKEYGAMELEATALIAQQIGVALDFAHQRGVVHRDFKPGNVLFDGQGNAYLSDFGLAKIEGGQAITATETMLGTPDYMAPDWSQEGEPTPSVDIYAMAVTLYQMLAGDVPYKASTPMAVLMAHLSQPVPDIRQVRPDLSEPIAAVIRRGMAKKYEERYATVKEFAAAFSQAIIASAESIAPQSAIVTERYYYPNRWGLNFVGAAEQVLGRDALEALLIKADLGQYLEAFPPDNMKKAFPFEHVGRLMQAIYLVYGKRGASSISKVFGGKSFEAGTTQFGMFAKLSRAAYEAVPAPTRYWMGLEFFMRFFNNVSDQRVEIEDAGDHWNWRITRCPVCWGWHADEPVCYIAVGVLQGAFEWIDGKQRRIVETECVAKGDEACVIRIDKA